MTETAAPAVHTATDSATGAVINSSMTPEQRFNAILKAGGEQPIERKSQSQEFLTPATVARMQQLEAQKATATNRQANALDQHVKNVTERKAEDDAKRATKLSTPKVGPASGTPDKAGMDALAKAYGAMPKDVRETLREDFQQHLRWLSEGRTVDFAQWNNHLTPDVWEKTHAKDTVDDFIPIGKISKAALSGYTLPKLLPNQEYHKSVFAQLADARAAGFTQAQVDMYIKSQMQRDGWVKAS